MQVGFPILAGMHDETGRVGFLAELGGVASTRVLPLALTALGRLGQGGARDGDGRPGVGAGVTTQVPHAVLSADLAAIGFGQAAPRDLAAGCVFVPRDDDGATFSLALVAAALETAGLARYGWRAVPVHEDVLGGPAAGSRPGIVQVVVGRPAGATDDEFEQKLDGARREAAARALDRGLEPFSIVSLSHRRLVYKALVPTAGLADFYSDLRHPAFETAFTLFHRGLGADVDASWAHAQPLRMLAHDGALDASDSAGLDEALATVTHGGRDVLYALSRMEPWDGAAMIVFTDGRVVGAALDRDRRQPAPSVFTADGLVLVASEDGLLDVPEETILARDRLEPGDVVAVDLRARRFLDCEAVHRRLAGRRPDSPWLAAHRARGPASGELEADAS